MRHRSWSSPCTPFVDGAFAIGAGLGAPAGMRLWIVIFGILGIVGGVYTFLNPGMTAIALVFVIGAFAVVRGLAEIMTAIQLRAVIENGSTWATRPASSRPVRENAP
jgi:uncharacterized membrane protein HdeD (DUF308 family)